MSTNIPNLLNAEKLTTFIHAYISRFNWEIDKATLSRLNEVKDYKGELILAPPCNDKDEYHLLGYPVVIVSYMGVSLIVTTGQRSQRYDLYEYFGFNRREKYYD